MSESPATEETKLPQESPSLSFEQKITAYKQLLVPLEENSLASKIIKTGINTLEKSVSKRLPIRTNIETNSDGFFKAISLISPEQLSQIKTPIELINLLNKADPTNQFRTKGEIVEIRSAKRPIEGVFLNMNEAGLEFIKTGLDYSPYSGGNLWDTPGCTGFIPAVYVFGKYLR